MNTTHPMNNQIIADKADNITWAATGVTMLSAFLDWLHAHFGWLFSTGGLALMSVLIGLISGGVGLYYRRRDAKFAAEKAQFERNQEMRAEHAFIAQMIHLHGSEWRSIIGYDK